MSYGGGYGGGSSGGQMPGYTGWSGGGGAAGGAGAGQQAAYAAWAAQAASYSGAGGYGGGAAGGGYGGGYSSGGAASQMGGGRGGGFGGSGAGGGDIQSKLTALASGGGGGGFGSRGGGRGALASATGTGGRGGGRGGGYDMKKFAAYQTNNKRKFDGGGDFGGPDSKGGRFDRPKREKQKPREGREPELNIFIDKRFNFWNLPVKAKVILVSNIPQDVCQPDLLYNIFSFYGDVERIKLIRRANSCALIEFTTATFACIARDHLDGAVLRGEKLVVTFSRYDRVRLPHEAGFPADGNTKDFSGREYDKYKRYRTEDLKKNNMRKIIEPTSTIHISGIQSGKSPNDVKRLFESIGLHIQDCIGVAIKQKKPKENEPPGTESAGPKMFCYVQFGAVDDGLIGLANFGNSIGMRMSFAKDNLDTLKKNCIEKKLPLIMGDQKC